MKRYPLYIFDLDGTLYRGNDPIPHAVDTVQALKSDGAKVRYVTNNSGQDRQFFHEKLTRMGFPVELNEIMNSGIGSAKYLLSEGHKSLYVIGEPGLVQTLREAGLVVGNAVESNAVAAHGEPSDAVLVGICRSFSYDLMREAMQRIRGGQTFVATNPEARNVALYNKDEPALSHS